MNKLNGVLALAAFLIVGSAHATTIAIIDSGTDLTHKDLQSKAWVNPKDVDDAVDNDDNGYIDDVNGWNFADGNNKLIDRKFLGTFSSDVYKFFEVQTRLLKGIGTDEDKAWMSAARENTALIAELGTFGNFVHGTHVAGISARDADAARIMGLKIMATKVQAPAAMGGGSSGNGRGLHLSAKVIKGFLKLLAGQQSKALAPMSAYVKKENARVANCSFGTSTTAASTILKPILKIAMGRDATPEELLDFSRYFVSEIVSAGKTFATGSPKTLFVIAAGNDGTNNDELPTFPANLKLDNTITVAATQDYNKIASFSNYGEKLVEVAAPGVGILSTIPGDQYLTVSGTSQAAPFVTNAIGRLLDENPSLSNSDIKKILMETSDMKDFMKGKVVSGGIVNKNRAVTAAKLALSSELTAAIAAARLQVSDVSSVGGKVEQSEGFVLPIPSLMY
ncbi:MAG: S8 family serine peptidase [Bdellovibrionales bacterium]|nr:S8 family serine peptidase [Bdellovibrionales bacterium]